MTKKTDPIDALGAAYEKMYERAANDFHQLEEKTESAFHKLVDNAKLKAVELGEVTEQEAEKLAEWLKRDVADTAKYLSETGNEIQGWLGYESTLLESAVLDLMFRTADKTTLELLELKEKAVHPASYHTGEVTGPGTLVCGKCEEKLHFYKAGKIPPCPKCHGTSYHR